MLFWNDENHKHISRTGQGSVLSLSGNYPRLISNSSQAKLESYEQQLNQLLKDVEMLGKGHEQQLNQLFKDVEILGKGLLIMSGHQHGLMNQDSRVCEELQSTSNNSIAEANEDMSNIATKVARYVKQRVERAETAMLSGKALGFKCMSCDHPLDNLNPNRAEFLPTNFMPKQTLPMSSAERLYAHERESGDSTRTSTSGSIDGTSLLVDVPRSCNCNLKYVAPKVMNKCKLHYPREKSVLPIIRRMLVELFPKAINLVGTVISILSLE
eukprot:Gb_32142 [translate_table: standard]